MIYIKVLLPKGDWKTDREQEKEVAKDMKEKIWRMTQLYNSLHKISELSTKESIDAQISLGNKNLQWFTNMKEDN